MASWHVPLREFIVESDLGLGLGLASGVELPIIGTLGNEDVRDRVVVTGWVRVCELRVRVKLRLRLSCMVRVRVRVLGIALGGPC